MAPEVHGFHQNNFMANKLAWIANKQSRIRSIVKEKCEKWEWTSFNDPTVSGLDIGLIVAVQQEK